MFTCVDTVIKGTQQIRSKKSNIKAFAGKSVAVSSNRDNSKFILPPHPGTTYYSRKATNRGKETGHGRDTDHEGETSHEMQTDPITRATSA